MSLGLSKLRDLQLGSSEPFYLVTDALFNCGSYLVRLTLIPGVLSPNINKVTIVFLFVGLTQLLHCALY